MEKYITHNIDWQKASEAFELPIDLIIEFFNDGRVIGRLGEFIDKHHTQSSRQNENCSFDNLTKENKRREIRSCRNSVSFAASKEVGIGRKVTKKGFEEKLNNVDEFAVIDSRQINQGKLGFLLLTTDEVRNLPLGKNKNMSSDKFWATVEK